MPQTVIPEFVLEITPPHRSQNFEHLTIKLREAPGDYRPRPQNSLRSPLLRMYKSVRDLGEALYQSLFNDIKVKEYFEDCCRIYCDDHPEQQVKLRLVLDFQLFPEQPEYLLHLPWELLHDGNDWILKNPKLSLIRRFNVKSTFSQSISTFPFIRVLFVYAEPQDKSSVGGEEFLHQVVIPFQKKFVDDAIEIKILPHATKRELKRFIKKGFDIIHFLGHGEVETQRAQTGMLFLEHEENPVSDILTGTELATWITDAPFPPQLVVLSACHSGNPSTFSFLGMASTLFDEGIESVISMQTDLYTDEAQEFAETFYHELFSGFFIDDAVQACRVRLLTYERSRRIEQKISSLVEHVTVEPETPKIIWHPGVFYTLSENEPAKNVLDLPGWSVPVIFSRGDGKIRNAPELSIHWSVDQSKMVYVKEGRFYIDRFPVTRAQYKQFAEATGRQVMWLDEIPLQTILDSLKQDEDYYKSKLPATYITVEEAAAYARWVGKHLPTPEEWQQAALSGHKNMDSPYPWEEKGFLPRRCNTRESGHGQVVPVILSEVFLGGNAIGMYDIVGNVCELTQSKGGNVFICGGSFREYKEKCTIQTRRAILDPGFASQTIGFRCIASLKEVKEMLEKQPHTK